MMMPSYILIDYPSIVKSSRGNRYSSLQAKGSLTSRSYAAKRLRAVEHPAGFSGERTRPQLTLREPLPPAIRPTE